MINQRIFLNILDDGQKPIPGCRVNIENRKDKFEADTDYSGIVEFLVPLGIYALSIEHPLFKKKVYRMTLRDGFSFTRIILQRNGYSMRNEENIESKPMMNLNINTNESLNSTYVENKPEISINENINNIIDTEQETYEEPKNEEVNFTENIKGIEDIRNMANNFMKTEIFEGNGMFGAMGAFDGMNGATFEDILNGAKAILQDIMEFAENVDFDNSKYTEEENIYKNEDEYNVDDQTNNPYKRAKNGEEWEPERIEIGDFDENYENDTYDVYDYEEEFFEPMSGSQGQ